MSLEKKAADENADFHFVIEFPKDNVMDVVKPKEKDVIVIGCATQVAPEHISLMQNASPQEKNKFLFDISTNLNLFLVDYELKVIKIFYSNMLLLIIFMKMA